ncbi:MAG: hypothetical protein JWN46_2017 [Acidimicrobiales bacterium]|nr:hypothetical protein [Acidimicrobiales bacterium]
MSTKLPLRRVAGGIAAMALSVAALTACQPSAPPPTRPVGTYPVAVSQVTAYDGSRSTPPRGSVPGHAGRTLVTTIYRPALPGPWPLILWAHGWNVGPSFNAALLQALASAGFVVAAPAFPGSASGYPGSPSHNDVGNQAQDLGFLIGWLQANAPGDIDFSSIGAAGHSDGGSTVAALALHDGYQDHRFRAFAVLSGVLSFRIGGSFGPRNTAPLLAMAGTNNEFGDYPFTRMVYDTAAAPKAWISLGGASHTSAYFGSGPQADSTRAAIADFFSLQLRPLGSDLDRFMVDAQSNGLSLTLPTGDPVLQRWQVFGGQYGPLGGLVGGPGPDGRGGRWAVFGDGAVVQSSAGLREVHGFIWRHWRDLGSAPSFLGEPTTDESAAADGVGRFNAFAGGAIYWSPGSGAHELHGPLWFAWAAQGAERGILGYPTGDGQAVGDGRGVTQRFQGGSLWGSSASGYHVLLPVFEFGWAAAGGPTGPLGYPVTDPWSFKGIGITSFEHGAVYLTPTGLSTLFGPIYAAYVNTGSVGGRLGPPIGSITKDRQLLVARFAHGYITYDPGVHQVTVVSGPDHRPR